MTGSSGSQPPANPTWLAFVLYADPLGSLHAGRATSDGRAVLLRILEGPAASDPDARARFDRAARLSIAVYHERLALVYEAGELEGRAYKSANFEGAEGSTDDRLKLEWVVSAPQGGAVKVTARHERAGVVRVELLLK